MNKSRRVQIGQAAYDVSIRRPSKWGNPYVLGVHGDRKEVIALYETWIRQQPELIAALPELKGKVLGCVCEDGRKCHGDVLLKLLKEFGIENESD